MYSYTQQGKLICVGGPGKLVSGLTSGMENRSAISASLRVSVFRLRRRRVLLSQPINFDLRDEWVCSGQPSGPDDPTAHKPAHGVGCDAKSVGCSAHAEPPLGPAVEGGVHFRAPDIGL